MQKKAIYQKWEPIRLTHKPLYCEAVYDDYEGFRILFKGEDKTSPMLRVSFESVLTYRNIDEGDYMHTLDLIDNESGHPFYIVNNSSLVKWFHKESYGIHEDTIITHYAFYTSNDCIDVLSSFEPKVGWLNK
ncbi:hypothetical protein DENIS_0874 [Desulfonema ishimotonii]|uniref:Uncharacterized protein n=1 Tax=Desulfonema ishimotonii TaxID=45657 RepID=A0A401FSI1_9BACT|nr:hypothetical protein [Desulfonema ishimotonii]GBC59932.1 hypothetical protein DENIS_0874 [Desulfonema ishimotonii]